MFLELWNAFCDWAAEALNWLENFFSKVWEAIVSWWDAICDTINDWLSDDDDEVVVIDVNTSIGADIYRTIKEQQPKVRSASKYNKREVLHFDSSTGELKEVANFETNNVQRDDDFSRDLRNDNGILRLNK